MATEVAPPKNTAGGGFVFENDVCAWLLACVLVGEKVLYPALGEIVRLDFQTRPDGWLLDDVLVTTATSTGLQRTALSVKSNAQFTASGAPADLVAAAWEQWLQVGTPVFDPSTDFMGIVTGPMSSAARTSLTGLFVKIRDADPALFPARQATEKWANEQERDLFASFACPQSLAATYNATEADTVRLLRRLSFRQHDFGEPGSTSLNASLQICQRAIRGGSESEAENLWNALRALATELRPAAGHITRAALIERLRGAFVLADYPTYAVDWRKLEKHSSSAAAQVPNLIAGRIALDRNASVQALADALEKHACIALVGESGIGKSVVARSLLEARSANGKRTLWFDASSFEHPDFNAFEASLRLTYPLGELLAADQLAGSVLVVDGLDRIYSDNAFRNAARLLRLARQAAPAAQWLVVVPCQGLEWPRILASIQRAGFTDASWGQIELDRLSGNELAPVRKELPTLERLFLHPRLSALLGNLKVVDLVVRHSENSSVDTTNWVGESSVADWFWMEEVERGQNRIARGSFARKLAQMQADELLASVPIDEFDFPELVPVESLTVDRICVKVPVDRLAFGHDLFGDWARLRILLSHRVDLPDFLRERSGSPLWHRAIRLYGIHLLEQSGVEEWRKTLTAFRTNERGAVHDLLLEAPVFAVNAAELLEVIVPDLIARDGTLLRRLLTRFLAFATIPDTEKLALAQALKIDPSLARAKYRVPYWPYWTDVLQFLHGHRGKVLAVAPYQIARVVEMWLDFAPKGSVMRIEAAELGVLLGRWALERRHEYGQNWEQERKRFYKCVLAAAQERPDEVTEIALTACERTTTPSDASVTRPRRGRRRSNSSPRAQPWPDGPRASVDDAFRDVVLDSTALLDLFRVRARVANEVVLANLIEPPDEDDSDGYEPYGRPELEFVDRHQWQPAFYLRGPFLGFLNHNFDEGLDLVLRLVHFATSRWHHYASEDAEAWKAKALARGPSEANVEETIRLSAPQDLVLTDKNGSRSFVGDGHVYAWSAGLGDPPDAVHASLMALEQHFYLKLEKGEEIAAEVEAVFARTTSVALLGVLVDIGKRHPVLFEGPLRQLLAGPELYLWEIPKLFGGTDPILGALGGGDVFVKLARAFNDMPHRKTDLRRLATSLLMHRPTMRGFFEYVVAMWRQAASPAPDGRVNDMREQMIRTLDFKNYEERQDPELGTVLVNIELQRVYASTAAERKAIDDDMLVSGFPMRCRRLLDQNKSLSAEEVETLWNQWQRIRTLALANKKPTEERSRFGDEYSNAIAGGAAVLLSQPALPVGSARSDEALKALTAVVENPPKSSVLDSAENLTGWAWDSFAAEALALLWVCEQANSERRAAVANMVFAPHYQALKQLFARCAEQRASLGADLSRLRRLALEWAYVWDRADLLRHLPREALQLDDGAVQDMQKSLSDWREERIAAFVLGTMGTMPADWTECDTPARFAAIDTVRGRWHRARAMNFRVVQCAHEWLPLLERAQGEAERADWIQFWRSALSHVLQKSQNTVHYPHNGEHWVLDGVAILVLQLRPEERAEGFWQPIIDLTGDAHNWPEVFLRSFHRHALAVDQAPASYVPLVRQIVVRAFVDVEAQRRWRSFEDIWEGLLGMDSFSSRLWEDRHASLAAALVDVFDFWMVHVKPDERRLINVASWLSRPAAAPVRLRFLEWFGDVLSPKSAVRFRDSRLEDVGDALAGLLNVIWSNDEQQLRAHEKAFRAFRELLSWLVEQQNQQGLELAGRIGGFG